MTTKHDPRTRPPDELDDDARFHIEQVFHDTIAPVLRMRQARIGALSCEFAGARYTHWVIRFESVGSGFVIRDYHYDEDACGIDLEHHPPILR